MSHNTRIRPTDEAWAFGTVVLGSEFAALDRGVFEAVNGDWGGEWSPDFAIVIRGAGMRVLEDFRTGQSTIIGESGTDALTVNAAATLNANANFMSGASFFGSAGFGGSASFHGPVTFGATASISIGCALTTDQNVTLSQNLAGTAEFTVDQRMRARWVSDIGNSELNQTTHVWSKFWFHKPTVEDIQTVNDADVTIAEYKRNIVYSSISTNRTCTISLTQQEAPIGSRVTVAISGSIASGSTLDVSCNGGTLITPINTDTRFAEFLRVSDYWIRVG